MDSSLPTIPEMVEKAYRTAEKIESMWPLMTQIIADFGGDEFSGHADLTVRLERYCYETTYGSAKRIREYADNARVLDAFMLFRAKTQELAFEIVEIILMPDATNGDPVEILKKQGNDDGHAAVVIRDVRNEWQEIFPEKSLYDILERINKITRNLKLE